ncbi:MAG: PAS domain-containing protein [Candidatus Omnitrophica bacterium]|nr:PAS domain-containing protein [Candidatus Omnitrophota bacterium]MBU1997058.1 PAS domain-containing protein [Candidatus Omnitrophota bacterium]
MYEGVSRDQLIDKANLLKDKLSKLEKKNPKSKDLSEPDMFRNLIEHSKDYIVVSKFDMKATLEYLSPSYEEKLDYKIKDCIGRSAFAFIHPKDKLELLPLLQRYIFEKARLIFGKEMRGFSERIAYRLKAKNGEWRNIDAIAFNYKDRIFYIGRDVTERLKAEEKLKNEIQGFQFAARADCEIIYEWDFENNKIEWYGDIFSSLGYKDGVFGRTVDDWLQAIHPDDREQVRKEVEGSRGMSSKRFLEYRIKTNDDEYRYWEDMGTYVVDSSGKPIKMIGTCRDVTSHKTLVKDISAKIESFEKNNESLRARELSIIEYKEKIKNLEREIQKLKMGQ